MQCTVGDAMPDTLYVHSVCMVHKVWLAGDIFISDAPTAQPRTATWRNVRLVKYDCLYIDVSDGEGP